MKTKKEELQAELTRLNALRKQVKEKLRDLPLLEVGKWYKGTFDFESLIFITEIENVGSYNRIHGYGFTSGKWNYLSHLFSNTAHEKSLVKATPQEVEQALIEEAKSRYKVGDVIKCFDSVESEVKGTAFVFYNNCLFSNGESFGNSGWLNTYGLVFKNGQWATIIKQDKFAELKEAHRNGAEIEIWSGLLNKWFVVENEHVLWLPNYEYRIKPEEKPKVGDVCRFWDDDEGYFVIGILTHIDNDMFPYLASETNYYKEAKTITQQEVINLLFNKGAN